MKAMLVAALVAALWSGQVGATGHERILTACEADVVRYAHTQATALVAVSRLRHLWNMLRGDEDRDMRMAATGVAVGACDLLRVFSGWLSEIKPEVEACSRHLGKSAREMLAGARKGHAKLLEVGNELDCES